MSSRFPSIEIRQIRYFVAASDHGSFRRAGAFLGVTESSISRRVRDLENEIGTSLFYRHPSGVRLTIAGQYFLRPARAILQNICDSARDIASIGRAEDGHIRIGVVTSLGAGFLADLLRIYGQKHKEVSIDLVAGEPPEHLASLKRLELDIAFVTGRREWPDCDTALLRSERIFVALPDNHFLIQKSEINWQDLVNQPLSIADAACDRDTLNYIFQRLAHAGHDFRTSLRLVGQDGFLPLITVDGSVTLTSEAAITGGFPNVNFRPMADEFLQFRAVWSPKNDNPALQHLLNIAGVLSRKMGPSPPCSAGERSPRLQT